MRVAVPLMNLLDGLARRRMRDRPDKVIGSDYLSRWYVLPRNPLFNIYLHQVSGSDPDEHLHDHPWLFNYSLVLQGCIREIRSGDSRDLPRGSLTGRLGRSPHRLLLLSDRALTLFVTGPKWRRWGFYTDDGWVASKLYLRADGNGRDAR